MDRYIKNFMKYRNLLKELVMRDIKIKYRRSVLGLAWSLLNPLLMMIVISIVFSQLFRFKIPNYPIYLITGQIMFTFISESTNMAMASITGNASLIKKVYIPKYIFPVAKTLSSFVNLLFSLIAVVIVILVTQVKITWTILLFPIPLLAVLAFAMGIGLILSAYSVFFRDIVHLYGVFLMVWNYMTPIFYPESLIEKHKILLIANPLYHIIKYFREIILYGTVPSLGLTTACVGTPLAFLLLGMYLFYRKQDKFILYI